LTDIQSLDRAVLRAFAWTGAVRWGIQILSWVSTIVVARKLSPDDYGIVGMATVYVGFTALVTEFGVGSAIVALQNVSRSQLAQLNTLAFMLGLAGALLSLALAFPIGWFFQSAAVPFVVMALSCTLVLDSLRSAPAAALARQMQFKSLAIIEGVSNLIVSGVTVALAFAGWRYWALVLGVVVNSTLATLFVLLRHPVPFHLPRRSQLVEAIDYSRNFLVGSVSWYFYSHADFVVAGRMLGSGPLGEYTYAWTLASAPIEKIATVVNRVVPPLYSAVSTDKAALRRYLLKLTQAMSLLIFPLATGLCVVADDAIRVLLGEKWIGSIAPLRFLALYALFQAMSLLVPPILLVTGHVRIAARVGLIAAAVLPVGFVFGGLSFGTTGIAAMWVVLYPLVLFAMCRVAFREIDLGYRDFLQVLIPAATACVCMSVVVVATAAGFRDAAPIWKLAVEILVGGMTYVVVLYAGWRRSLFETIAAIRLLK
jgi:O-antigen/teichoic acid export membrane protein